MHIIGLWEEAVVPRQNSGFILGLSAPCCCQTDCNNRGGKCDWGHFWSKWLFAYFTTSNMQSLEEQLLRTRKTQTATCVKLLATIKDNMSYVASSLKNKKLTVMIWFNRKIKIFNPTNQRSRQKHKFRWKVKHKESRNHKDKEKLTASSNKTIWQVGGGTEVTV